MGRRSFENYGYRARSLTNQTVVAGRYRIQEEAEGNILPDIISKLNLRSTDTVLEIGCGTGNLLIPLRSLVREATGIDHPSCLEILKGRCNSEINLIPGNFLDVAIERVFDKILCYSVLHYLQNESEVVSLIAKALQLLAPGGCALFGDIPNTSYKARFINSESGKRFVEKWEQLLAASPPQAEDSLPLDSDQDCVVFNDDLTLEILRVFRQKGFHTYVFPQPPDLPFGNTREDILIVRPG